ncbi:hypothetical protein, partial [Brucella sp. BO2]|uniref:hypothetical protein n=1 Tax=Brucella sp. BO2 TaxID=693750 RepID=UPI0005B37DC0
FHASVLTGTALAKSGLNGPLFYACQPSAETKKAMPTAPPFMILLIWLLNQSFDIFNATAR